MEKRYVQTITFPDPTADKKIPALRVPDRHVYTIEKAYATLAAALAAHATNIVEISLINGGTDQAGTPVIGGPAGGTAGWAANTPQEIVITAGLGDLTAGQWLLIDYAEGGTVAPDIMAVTIEYVDGIGSKA